MVDGEMKNEHVTGGKTGDGVGDSRQGSRITAIVIFRVSPNSGSCV